jgi:hypothetical protein
VHHCTNAASFEYLAMIYLYLSTGVDHSQEKRLELNSESPKISVYPAVIDPAVWPFASFVRMLYLPSSLPLPLLIYAVQYANDLITSLPLRHDCK